jgi:hypothetical protein
MEATSPIIRDLCLLETIAAPKVCRLKVIFVNVEAG